MSTVDGQGAPCGSPDAEPADLKLAAVVIPVTDHLPGRLDPTTTSFDSAGDRAAALHSAGSARTGHETRIGWADSDWPDRYAECTVRERNGQELPV